MSYDDHIEVAEFHYASNGTGWNCEICVVGRGILSRWWYDIERDGDCYI